MKEQLKSLAASDADNNINSLGLKIVVLDKGFVYVGRLYLAGRFALIEGARCIRHWGTTNGLAELTNGPTSNTVLDAKCNVMTRSDVLVFWIEADESKWSNLLK